MSRLNEDIIGYILDLDHRWKQSEKINYLQRRELSRLALISSTWVQPVRRRLYASPSLGSFSACCNLARTIEENPALILLIRMLDLHPNENSSSFRTSANRVTPESCPGVARLLELTYLEKLILRDDLEFHAERYLRMVGSPHTIKTLEIRGPSTLRLSSAPTPKTRLVWNGEFALKFHALESLTLQTTVIHIDDSHYDLGGSSESDTSILLQGCVLKELTLKNVVFEDDSGLVCALLRGPAPWQQLRALTFTRTNCSRHDLEKLVSVLRIVHNTLEQLTFIKFDVPSTLVSHLRVFLKDIPPLRRLRFLEAPFELIHEDFRYLTDNVETAAVFGGSYESDWSACLKAGKDNLLPNLRKLLLRSALPQHPWQHDASIALQKAFQERGVHLAFRSW